MIFCVSNSVIVFLFFQVSLSIFSSTIQPSLLVLPKADKNVKKNYSVNCKIYLKLAEQEIATRSRFNAV